MGVEELASERVGEVPLHKIRETEAAPAGSSQGHDGDSRQVAPGLPPLWEPAAGDSDEEMPDFELA